MKACKRLQESVLTRCMAAGRDTLSCFPAVSFDYGMTLWKCFDKSLALRQASNGLETVDVCMVQEAGLIVMQIESAEETVEGKAVHDPNFSQVWVLLNAKPQAVSFPVPAGLFSPLRGQRFQELSLKACLYGQVSRQRPIWQSWVQSRLRHADVA